jgi:hypothetical protein
MMKRLLSIYKKYNNWRFKVVKKYTVNRNTGWHYNDRKYNNSRRYTEETSIHDHDGVKNFQ